ncbi:MAG TPA: LamG domain-containing protein [Draconibacterium sp.]|nr:LamG domain-containing protein [Draconibacterium sp.]
MKRKKSIIIALALCLTSIFQIAYTQNALRYEKIKDSKISASWDFNFCNSRILTDNVSNINDSVQGNFKLVNGISGKALKLDGFSTRITRKASQLPELGDSFTVEAWIAAATYPWNWVPILAQGEMGKSGFYFGVGPQGQVGISASIDGTWQSCETKGMIELREWIHVVATYNQNFGFRIYLNGKHAGSLEVSGKPVFAKDMDLLIGMNSEKVMPSNPVRTYGTMPSWFSFDGIYDEIKIYNEAFSSEIIAAKSIKPDNLLPPEIEERVMPSGPKGKGKFGAYYTKLKYYDEWDALFRVGDHPDIVVQFDDSPIRVVFWRGTRYSPAWVMENGQWMADQSAEYFDTINGCFEHMIDPHCLYSHVRIIENTAARVVVHWRYIPVSVRKQFSQIDEITDWSDCIDEYYTFYPDGIGIRKIIQHTSGEPLGPSEAIVLCQPGTKPEDNVHLDAMTLVNLDGDYHTYSWANGAPVFKKGENPVNPVIQIVNLKSENKPFMIFEKENNMEVYGIEQRLDVSHFPWWNHWPVAQNLCDGRYSQAADRPSHFSLAWGGPPFHDEAGNIIKARVSGSEGKLKLEENDSGKTVKNFWSSWMYGATKQSSDELAVLARSWLQPPVLKVLKGDFVSNGYDFTQRAYILDCNNSKSEQLEVELLASSESPVVNVSMVINGWEKDDLTLHVDGRKLEKNKDYWMGKRRELEKEDVIIWIKNKSEKTLKISLKE